MTDPVTSKAWKASQAGKLVQALVGALLLGWIAEASPAEMTLMYMVLNLHLDVYYG